MVEAGPVAAVCSVNGLLVSQRSIGFDDQITPFGSIKPP